MSLDYQKIATALGRALLANELGGQLAAAYRFSDAGGKSGVSFGRCQWDLNNNPAAAAILKECGFTQLEIAALESKQLVNKTGLNAKLMAAKDIVDKYDQREIGAAVDWVRNCCEDAHVEINSDEAFVHLCDYHNQFYLNPHGKCMQHLIKLARPVSAEDILAYKKTTTWGKSRPDDIWRRWNNIHRIFNP